MGTYSSEWMSNTWQQRALTNKLEARVAEKFNLLGGTSSLKNAWRRWLSWMRAVVFALLCTSCATTGLSPATSTRLEIAAELKSCQVNVRGDRNWTTRTRPDEAFRARDCRREAEAQCLDANLEASCATDESWGGGK
jgi:hypothetical protein